MFSLNENAEPASSKMMQRIQTLIIGRLMTIFVLLITIWIWNSGHLRLAWDQFPQVLFIVFLISVGLTIVYFFLLRLWKNFSFQIGVQFVLDSLLITWLMWRSGDLSSPYLTLYIVLISVGSAFLRPLPTLLLASFCSLQLIAISMMASLGVLELGSSGLAAGKFLQIVSFNVVACLVVGLLASRLSDRRVASEQLQETTKTLANLRLLHERTIESIRSGLITTDLEGNIYTFNAAATEITGFRAEVMQGASVYKLFGDIYEPIRLSMDAAEDGGQAPRFETDLLTPEGFAVRVGYSISPLFFRIGRIDGADPYVPRPYRDPLDGGQHQAKGSFGRRRACRGRPGTRDTKSAGCDARRDPGFGIVNAGRLDAGKPYGYHPERIRQAEPHHYQLFELREAGRKRVRRGRYSRGDT